MNYIYSRYTVPVYSKQVFLLARNLYWIRVGINKKDFSIADRVHEDMRHFKTKHLSLKISRQENFIIANFSNLVFFSVSSQVHISSQKLIEIHAVYTTRFAQFIFYINIMYVKKSIHFTHASWVKNYVFLCRFTHIYLVGYIYKHKLISLWL